MQFKEQKAIYLQIAHRICDEIILGQYTEDGRVPSVREYAALVEVNANTVMRAFEYLQNQEIIYNQRGKGNFVSQGAKKRILETRKNTFLHEELEDVFKHIYTLEIPIEEIVARYQEYQNQQKNN